MSGGILTAIGNTPLVPLSRLIPDLHFRLFAKLEALNPAGSVKDRSASRVVLRGIETGAIGPDTVIIESSSGNMGIGLAQACAYFGLRFICVVDPRTTRQNIEILQAYSAEVDMVEQPESATGECLQAGIDRFEALPRVISNSFGCMQ